MKGCEISSPGQCIAIFTMNPQQLFKRQGILGIIVEALVPTFSKKNKWQDLVESFLYLSACKPIISKVFLATGEGDL